MLSKAYNNGYYIVTVVKQKAKIKTTFNQLNVSIFATRKRKLVEYFKSNK
jgi:hypothetical protein